MDSNHRVAEAVQLLFGFAFGWLNHEGTWHWPAHRRRVKPIVNETLGDILDLDTSLGDLVGLIAERKQIDVTDVMAIVLDRDRHREGIDEIRAVGARVRVRGTLVVDKRHGEQLRAESVTEVAPTTIAGIEKYLGSGMIKGVGAAYAKRIVERFGLDTLRVLDLKSGKELWTFAYDAPGAFMFAGSRTTPTVDSGHVYTVGPMGDLHAISVKTRKPAWRANVWKDFGGGTELPRWAIVQNPLIHGDLLIVAPQTPDVGVVA